MGLRCFQWRGISLGSPCRESAWERPGVSLPPQALDGSVESYSICIHLGKVATSATLLIVKEITGNKNGNKAATDRQHSFRVDSSTSCLRIARLRNAVKFGTVNLMSITARPKSASRRRQG